MSNLSDGHEALIQLDAQLRLAELAEQSCTSVWRPLADELCDAREKLADRGRQIELESGLLQRLVAAALPACKSAAEEASALAERLAKLSTDGALGVGEARALLAEAAYALAYQAAVQQAQATALAALQRAGLHQGHASQAIQQAGRTLRHAERLLSPLVSAPALPGKLPASEAGKLGQPASA